MNSANPVTIDQLIKLRKFEHIGKKYLAEDESNALECDDREGEQRTFKFYLQHPCARLATVLTLIILDFYLIAQNPISYSGADCKIDVIGNIYSFIFLKYPNDGFAGLKVLLWISGLLLGLIVGRLVIHKWILCTKLKSRFFARDSQGAWIIMFLTSILSLYGFSLLYNVILDVCGGYILSYKCDNSFKIENKCLMKAIAAFIWIGNIITIWIIIDMMLQEKKYSKVFVRIRAFWCKGNQRMVIFWLMTMGSTILIVTAITTDFIHWDQLHKHFITTDEFSRACLASAAIFLEILVLIQDWDFPHFANNGAAKLPGLSFPYLRSSMPCCCTRSKCSIIISGKWFSYGTLVLVIILQFIMWTRQIHYMPTEYGQFTDSEGTIHNILENASIKEAKPGTAAHQHALNHPVKDYNETYLASSNNKFDSITYKGYSMRLKALSFAPWMFAVCLFFYLAHQYGKHESPDERMVRKWKQGKIKRRKRRVVPAKETSLTLDFEKTKVEDTPSDLGRNKSMSSKTKNTLEWTSEKVKMSKYEHTNFDYYFKHPNSRLFIAYFLVFLTWLMFAQDPIAYSSADCRVKVLGHAYSFIFLRYPSTGYAAMKFFFWLSAIVAGMILGKTFVHKVLLCRILRFKIFTSDGEGSWVIMFLTTVVSLFTWTFLYNETISASGNPQYMVSSNMEMKYKTFMKGALSISWLAHFLTAWMVTDSMLQQKQYPRWAKDLRYFWRSGNLRVIIFWVIAVAITALTIFAVCFDLLSWETMNRNLLSSNEVSRSFLASFIIVFDLLVIMQDWQFPNFDRNSKIKLPGLKRKNLDFRMFCVNVKIKGKWLCYGLVAIVLIIDTWTWSNQLFYEPAKYGQYVTGSRQVYSIPDAAFIRNANETMTSFRFRSSCIVNGRSLFSEDFDTNTKYFGDNLAKKSAAFIPALVTFTWFVVSAIKAKKPVETFAEK